LADSTLSTQDTESPAAADPGSVAAAQASAPAGLSGRRMAGAALIVMICFVLSRVTGLAREVVVGARFGTGLELDAYLAAFRVPDLLFQMVAGGALGSAFIPTFSTYWVRSDWAGAWQLFSRVLNWITLLLTVLAGVAALFALPLVRWIIAPGFAPDQQLLTAQLMRWMLLSTVVFGASGLVMGTLNAVQHFLLPAVAPVLYNLAIIVGAWWLAPTWGVYGLVMGVVAGAVAHLVVQLPALVRRRARYQWDWTWRDPGVYEVMRLMGPRVLGLFFVQMHFLVNTILASGLAVGSLSALNYAWLIMLLPQGIFAQAIATAAFPTFAAQVAAQQPAAMRRTFGQTLRTVLFLTIPAAVGLYMLRTPLVQVLLQRGAFNADSTAMVAYALQFYAMGLAAHAVVEMTVRAFYALHDTWTPVRIGVVAMVLNIVFSLWWVRWWSYGGLALANSVATGLEMVALLWLLQRRMDGIELRQLLQTVVRSGVAAIAMGGALWGWLHFLGYSVTAVLPSGTAWIAAAGGIGIALLVYGAISVLLGSLELKAALALAVRRRPPG